MLRRTVVILVGLIGVLAACSNEATPSTSTAPPLPATTVVTTTITTATPTTSAPSAEVTLPPTENLARTAEVRASVSHPDFPAADAIDGNRDTWWSAGTGPSQWVELDLGVEATITSIRLIVSQDPAGDTVHRILGNGVLLETVAGTTADLDTLEVVPDAPWTGITTLRIETTASPSWVAWREIEVIGFVTGDRPEPEPDVVFTGGTILTMTDQPGVTALAVTGDLISAVGPEDEILATAGPGTEVIDLEGRTLMPGFVDPHTHILNDAWRLGFDTLDGQQLALENGITTLANLFTAPEFLDEMRGYEAAGQLRARVSLYLIATDNCGTPQGDWWMEHPPTRTPGEMLRIGGIKLFLDGGSCGPWAVTQEVEPGGGVGELFVTTDEVIRIIDAAASMGHQVVIHSIGDRATLAALDAYAATTDPSNPLRHRIDHLTMVTDEVIARFGPSGVVGAVFGYYPSCADFAVTEFYDANTRRHPELMAASPDSVIVWHGDDPWVGPVSPLQELYSMITRGEILEDGTECEAPDFLADRTFDVETALRMMTIDAAYALFRDDEVGSLEVGKYADLVVLSADPTAVPPREVFDIEVLATIVGGRTEVCRDGGVCPG